MPNWCECELSVKGKKKDLDNFQESVAKEDRVLDEDNILPYPEEFRIADEKAELLRKQVDVLSPEEAQKWYRTHTIKYGFNQGGYDWCIKNWGTKWGFCEVTRERLKTCIHYSFETAWSPPIPLIFKASQLHPNVTLVLKYYEMGAGYKGVYKVKAGKMIIDKYDSIYTFTNGKNSSTTRR